VSGRPDAQCAPPVLGDGVVQPLDVDGLRVEQPLQPDPAELPDDLDRDLAGSRVGADGAVRDSGSDIVAQVGAEVVVPLAEDRGQFVHGNPETAAVWDPLLAELERAGVSRAELVCLSPPGFAAPWPAGFGATVRDYRDWLIGELTDVGEPVDLVGHDWGGGHVVNVAMSRPDLIRSWASDVVGIFDPGTAIRRPRRGAGRGTCRAGNERAGGWPRATAATASRDRWSR
jgi:pimeloyl-ACP methyl ester carboxylesterase